MTKVKIAALVLAAGLLFGLAFAGGRLIATLDEESTPGASAATVEPRSGARHQAHESLIRGRVTIDDGSAYEGRLRFGGDEEAFWGDFFNGTKADNPWAADVPPEKLVESRPVEVFGVRLARRQRAIDLGRPFMARFGDIARIEASGRLDLRVQLKSGTVFALERFSADDFADGVRVWTGTGLVDLAEARIRSIELLPDAASGAAPERLHGRVRTTQGDFTGYIQWNRRQCLGTDEIGGRSGGEKVRVRFDAIRSIARESAESSRVTRRDGREVVLTGTREAGRGHRGVYVDDSRYGRVLVSWEAFERIDFSLRGEASRGAGPAYRDFPAGRPLRGRVTVRDGRRLAGRLVYDLDESETTETLDAPSGGIHYIIPFGLIARLALPARVVLHSGEELQLESSGDLSGRNTGVLVYSGSAERPDFVPWLEVTQIDFERPSATFPPIGGP